VGKIFGMRSLYRGKVIFGALPGTRGLWEADAIMVKMHDGVKGPEGKKWQSVRVQNDAALTMALERLGEAYRSAK
jgi:hypothetical protein